MLPYAYLQSNLIPTNGSAAVLKSQGNFVLSVSATPFSEFAANVLSNQDKATVYLNPGPQYLGIPYFVENDIIVPHQNEIYEFRRALTDCKKRNPVSPKYGIVRAVSTDEYMAVASANGWDCVYYDMETCDIDIRLIHEPTQNTIVFIKGALRMGQQVCKKYLGFCFETSDEPNTDTLLQGLLGRVCSFEPASTINNIRIYIHTKVMQTGEIKKYVDFIRSFESNAHKNASLSAMPVLAANVFVSQRGTQSRIAIGDTIFEPGVPIRIPRKYMDEGETAEKNKKAPLMATISAILNDIANFPEIEISQECASELEKRLSEKHSVHNWSSPTYASKMKKLAKACIEKRVFRSGSRVEAVHLWKVDAAKEEFPDFEVGDIIIEVSRQVVKDANDADAKIPPMPTFLRVSDDAAFVQCLQRIYQKSLAAKICREKNVEMTDALKTYINL
jgi:hypothetical protein